VQPAFSLHHPSRASGASILSSALASHKTVRVLAGAAAVLATLFFGLRLGLPLARARLSDLVRQRSIQIVRERFQANVTFGQFTIAQLYPRVLITGANVTLTREASANSLPLMVVQNFSFSAGLARFLRKPTHVQRLELTGMRISVPPRQEEQAETAHRVPQHYPVIVDNFECHDCELNILPKNPVKRPLKFSIHQLSMQNVGLGRSAPYRARLTNAVPKGEIDATGRFGPWQPEEPSLTPLSGNYVFTHADLYPFPGIGGTLDSTGHFEGQLERIVADGTTSTPDFSLDVIGRPLPLDTQFHAIIDGTTGDTALDPVRAKLLNSVIVARGGVFGMPDSKGRAVLLDVTVNPGRLEDILRLGVKADRPPLVGGLRFHTQLAVLPGSGKVLQRLKLNGRFFARAAQPTNPAIQEKLQRLSRRAQGKPGNEDAGADVFNLNGRFLLNHSAAYFPAVSFTIPGAKLDLDGAYDLYSERLDFSGDLRLDAKLSQTVTGFKSLLLKPVDPFFRKQGKTVLPVRITGLRSDPKFQLQLHRSKEPRPEYRAGRVQ
jgi:hypothetical protein